MAKSDGRSGHKWREARKRVIRRDKNTPGYVCPLCGNPIDWSLKVPDPWAVQVDHVIPLSRLPKNSRLRNSTKNLRCVHALCNQRKGNGRRPHAPKVVQSIDWI